MSRDKHTSLKNEREKILLYGVTGMLGSKISQLLGTKYRIIAPPHSLLDLTDTKKVIEHLEEILPDQIIYASGLTKVDQAEANPELAILLNCKVVKNVATKAANLKIPFHYISTDAVFDGTNNKNPYKEQDKTSPVSVYGKSKVAGEEAVLSASNKNSVIRTIMLYSSHFPTKSDFTRVAYESLKRNEKFEGIVDQIINPTFVDDLVYAIELILEKKTKGIYHVAAKDFTTNFMFVEKIAEIFNFKKSLITKVKFDDFFKGKSAKRTQFCWLDTSKFQKEFGQKSLQTIEKSLINFKRQLNKIDTEPVNL